MAKARKLNLEVDGTLKRINEGVFEWKTNWQKLQDSDDAFQNAKTTEFLRRNIKKLQRLREQVRTWSAEGSVRDRETQLQDARRNIERQMERYKVIEKEAKVKAFSDAGLLRDSTDPLLEAKLRCADWIQDVFTTLQAQIEQFEADIELLPASKDKPTSKPSKTSELTAYITRHKHHLVMMDRVLRLLENDQVTSEEVETTLKDSMDYYLESSTEPEFVEDETMYDSLPLNEVESGVGVFTHELPKNHIPQREGSTDLSTLTLASITEESSSSVSPPTAAAEKKKEGKGGGKNKEDRKSKAKQKADKAEKTRSTKKSTTKTPAPTATATTTPTTATSAANKPPASLTFKQAAALLLDDNNTTSSSGPGTPISPMPAKTSTPTPTPFTTSYSGVLLSTITDSQQQPASSTAATTDVVVVPEQKPQQVTAVSESLMAITPQSASPHFPQPPVTVAAIQQNNTTLVDTTLPQTPAASVVVVEREIEGVVSVSHPPPVYNAQQEQQQQQDDGMQRSDSTHNMGNQSAFYSASQTDFLLQQQQQQQLHHQKQQQLHHEQQQQQMYVQQQHPPSPYMQTPPPPPPAAMHEMMPSPHHAMHAMTPQHQHHHHHAQQYEQQQYQPQYNPAIYQSGGVPPYNTTTADVQNQQQHQQMPPPPAPSPVPSNPGSYTTTTNNNNYFSAAAVSPQPQHLQTFSQYNHTNNNNVNSIHTTPDDINSFYKSSGDFNNTPPPTTTTTTINGINGIDTVKDAQYTTTDTTTTTGTGGGGLISSVLLAESDLEALRWLGGKVNGDNGAYRVPTASEIMCMEGSLKFVPELVDAYWLNDDPHALQPPIPGAWTPTTQNIPSVQQIPDSFPKKILPALHTATAFQHLHLETLFFAFYFQSGTRAQLLAANTLKELGWRYNTRVNAWFARSGQPTLVTPTYEQGPLVYFDWTLDPEATNTNSTGRSSGITDDNGICGTEGGGIGGVASSSPAGKGGGSGSGSGVRGSGWMERITNATYKFEYAFMENENTAV